MGGGAAGGLWRHQKNGRHLGFCWELEIRLKLREMVIFVLEMKNNLKISTLHDFSHKIDFYCWKKLKKHVLSVTNGLTTSHLWRHIF